MEFLLLMISRLLLKLNFKKFYFKGFYALSGSIVNKLRCEIYYRPEAELETLCFYIVKNLRCAILYSIGN